MKLRRNEYCPIHRSLFRCGREQSKMERRLRLGMQRIEDPHHPRGYRELRSPAEMRKLLNRRQPYNRGAGLDQHFRFGRGLLCELLGVCVLLPL